MWGRSGTSNGSYGNFYRSGNSPIYSSRPQANYYSSSNYSTKSYSQAPPVYETASSSQTPWNNPYASSTSYGATSYGSSPYSNPYQQTSYTPQATYQPAPAYTSSYSSTYVPKSYGGGCRACSSKSSYSTYTPAPNFSWQSNHRYGYP